MKSGIRANNKHSYIDFGVEIAERKISTPSQKRITETVPYMSGEYDFSNLDGEIALENRELSYSFEIAELSTTLMEQKKRKILSWLYSIVDMDIYDDYLSDYYFHGSLEKIDWSEDFGKGVLNVTFSVYPYMFEIQETTVKFSVNDKFDALIEVNSAHQIIPQISVSNEVNIKINEKSFSLSKGDYCYEDLKFKSGTNKIWLEGTSEVIFKYRNELI